VDVEHVVDLAARLEPLTLRIASVRAPRRRASRTASSVSMVSPDCDTATTSVRASDRFR
jgi:hypothetical protein